MNKLYGLAVVVLLLAGLALLTGQILTARAAGVIYVDADATGANSGTSWANAYTNLQSALTAATYGDEVWVAEGVYKPTNSISRSISFQLKPGVALYGGFAATETQRSQRNWEAHVVTLSGDIGATGVMTDNAYHVVVGSGVTESAVLDGFTVTGGYADGTGHIHGGGMYNETGSPTIRHVRFVSNYAAQYGGGMFNHQSGSPTLNDVAFTNNSCGGTLNGWGGGMFNHTDCHPALTNVTFISNAATALGGGMGNHLNSHPTLNKVTFQNNSAGSDGGGMHNSLFSTPTLVDVTFWRNTAVAYGGGMTNEDSNARLVNVIFISNTAAYGGGLFNNGAVPTLDNVLFSGNVAGAYFGGGMFNSYSAPTIRNATFSSNTARVGGGIYDDTGGSTVVNSILWNNRDISGTVPTGQIAKYGTSTIVTYSLVQGGWSGAGNLNADPQFVDADGPDNIAGTPDDDLRLKSTSPAIDAGNNNAVASDLADLDGDGNTSEKLPLDLAGAPRFVDHPRPDTGSGTPPIVDMGAYEMAQVLYVDRDAVGANNGASWADAFTEVQSALNVVLSGQEIWVAEGVYKPTTGVKRSLSFQLKPGVELYGGFAATETARSQRNWATHVVTLSGDIGATGVVTDNSYHVVVGSGVTESAVLDGLTITGGYADGTGDIHGGGMFNNGGRPTIRNVTFRSNYAAQYGGGLFNMNQSTLALSDVTFVANWCGGALNGDGGGMFNHTNSNATLTNVTFISNTATTWGGGMGNYLSNPTLNNVTFQNNSAGRGGGMYNESASPTLRGVTFTGNTATYDDLNSYGGGGMYNNPSSAPTLVNVTFWRNSAVTYGGGMTNDHSNARLVNVTFISNTAAYGGGVFNYYASPTLDNALFSGNVASAQSGGGILNSVSYPTIRNATFSNNVAQVGGGIYDYAGWSTVVNSILWGNRDISGTVPTGQIANNGDAANVTYSVVQGGWNGVGNLDADPQFVDADGPDNIVGTLDDDLRLKSTSPVIDAGDSTAVANDLADLDGDGNTSEKLPLDLAGALRLVDTVRPDVGSGTPPIVDMGAYESATYTFQIFLPVVIKAG